MVPRVVDDNRELFADKGQSWAYSVEQLDAFLARLPPEFRESQREEPVGDGSAQVVHCPSRYDLKVGFIPHYHVGSDKGFVEVPQFTLAFHPADKEGARKILEAALAQFYVGQADIVDGTMAVVGFIGNEVVHRDLELLAQFLPRGTPVESRCSYAGGFGRAIYHV